MPPPGKPQPKPEERDQLSARGLRESLLRIQPNFKDPGRVTIRRLNRAEYNNTIRDLLGVDTRPADAFPADGGGGRRVRQQRRHAVRPADPDGEVPRRRRRDARQRADRGKIFVATARRRLAYGSTPQTSSAASPRARFAGR